VYNPENVVELSLPVFEIIHEQNYWKKNPRYLPTGSDFLKKKKPGNLSKLHEYSYHPAKNRPILISHLYEMPIIRIHRNNEFIGKNRKLTFQFLVETVFLDITKET
jgi:hypothetical protein